MNARLLLPLAAAIALGVSTLSAQAPGAPRSVSATLKMQVPARYTKVTDGLGFVWDVNSSGGITRGSNCFMNSFLPVIDGDSISFQTQTMSADGLEYFYTANLDGLRFTRRIRVDAKGSYCRFIETLSNTSGAPRNFTFAIRARLSGRIQANGSDSGDRPFPFEEKDPGIIVGGSVAKTSSSSSPQPSFVWMLAGRGAKMRPTAQIEQSTYITATYPVTLAPGASVSLVHAAAQRTLGTKLTAKERAELFAPMTSARLLADLPVKERKDFANFAPAQSDGDDTAPGALTALQALLEASDIARDKADTVLLDAAAKVSGTVSGGALAIETEFGKADVPFADIAGIAGGGGVQRPVRVFLRDGEILAGAVSGEKFAMTTDSGLHFEIDLAQIQLLALRKGGGDGRPPENAAALLTTQRGDCLAVAQQAATELHAATPWGMLRVPLSEIVSLEYLRDPFPGHRLTLADRSRLPVMLRGDEWQVATTRFGKVKIAPQSVRELRNTATKITPPATDGEAGFANCELAGENRLAGVIDLPKLHLTSAKSTTPLDTMTITTLTREAGEDGSALVKITLADGQELSGRLVESTLPIRSGDRVWHVPAAHILSVNVPPPAKPKDETPTTPTTPAAPATPTKPTARTDDVINAPPDARPAPAPKQ